MLRYGVEMRDEAIGHLERWRSSELRHRQGAAAGPRGPGKELAQLWACWVTPGKG